MALFKGLWCQPVIIQINNQPASPSFSILTDSTLGGAQGQVQVQVCAFSFLILSLSRQQSQITWPHLVTHYLPFNHLFLTPVCASEAMQQLLPDGAPGHLPHGSQPPGPVTAQALLLAPSVSRVKTHTACEP